MASALTSRYWALRSAGASHSAAVRSLSRSTGLDLATVERVLVREGGLKIPGRRREREVTRAR